MAKQRTSNQMNTNPYRPRHWLAAVAVACIIGYNGAAAALLLLLEGRAVIWWSWVPMLFMIGAAASLLVYCTQWIVTLVRHTRDESIR